MKSISSKQLCKMLERHGWIFRRTHSSHHIYGKPGNPTILTVPVHANKDLKIGTLHKLLKQSGLTEHDF